MSDRLMVSTRKGWFDLRCGAKGWEIEQTAHLSIPVSIAMHDPRDGAIYCGLDHGHFGAKLLKSEDDGKSWEELLAPSYEGVLGGKTLKQIWCMAPAGDDQPGVIWAGSVPGGLFKSEDAGKSWALNIPLEEDKRWEASFGGGFDDPGIHSLIIDPRGSNRISIGVSVAGFWLTEDGGKTWDMPCDGMWAEYVPPDQKFEAAIQDPHMVVQCRDELDKFWCQHHNGIFRSSDNLESWQEITKAPVSNFGFAVAVDPRDGECAWFVPAVDDEFRIPAEGKLVVQRTRDGGKSFDVLTQGLPQKDAYHLIYRHGLDVDETGERLAMGSTTGGLWVSDNGGDSWQDVSQHLPPIYAVKFVPS
jgi:hypothetical protein